MIDNKQQGPASQAASPDRFLDAVFSALETLFGQKDYSIRVEAQRSAASEGLVAPQGVIIGRRS